MNFGLVYHNSAKKLVPEHFSAFFLSALPAKLNKFGQISIFGSFCYEKEKVLNFLAFTKIPKTLPKRLNKRMQPISLAFKRKTKNPLFKTLP